MPRIRLPQIAPPKLVPVQVKTKQPRRSQISHHSLPISGGVFSVETPIPEGPRQAGQSSHFANGGKDDARIASATTQKPLQFNMFILSFSQSPSGGFNQIMSTDGKPSRFHLPLVL